MMYKPEVTPAQTTKIILNIQTGEPNNLLFYLARKGVSTYFSFMRWNSFSVRKYLSDWAITAGELLHSTIFLSFKDEGITLNGLSKDISKLATSFLHAISLASCVK